MNLNSEDFKLLEKVRKLEKERDKTWKLFNHGWQAIIGLSILATIAISYLSTQGVSVMIYVLLVAGIELFVLLWCLYNYKDYKKKQKQIEKLEKELKRLKEEVKEVD